MFLYFSHSLTIGRSCVNIRISTLIKCVQEADKIALAEETGLDQKQINNWFINQRKRHWKPSENMPFAMMDDSSETFFTEE